MFLKTLLKILKKDSILRIIGGRLSEKTTHWIITGTDSYLMDNCNADKRVKATKKCVKKQDM